MKRNANNLGAPIHSEPSTPESCEAYDRIFPGRKPTYMKRADELIYPERDFNDIEVSELIMNNPIAPSS